jgi:hypothetical protein
VRARQLPATDPNRAAAYRFAKAQVDYVLGLAGGRSYVVGWGTNPPLRVRPRLPSARALHSRVFP